MTAWEETRWAAMDDSDPAVGGAVEYLREQAALSHQNGREGALSDKCAECLRECVKRAKHAREMARLLLELEWAARLLPDLGGFPACPACGNAEPDSGYGGPSFGPGHAPDCRLVAVLRAAGVVE